MEMLCTICKSRPAFYFRRHSGEKLCRTCFVKNFERRIYKTIKVHKLINRGEKVLIAVSGGKDSLVLLHILSKIRTKLDLKLLALTIDEGIGGYRNRGIELTKAEAKKLGIEHKAVSFKDAYGLTLEEIVKLASERQVELHPCSFCGILRRRLINEVALKEKAGKVATAHNLDDEAQTVLINLLRGDLPKVIRLGVKPPLQHEKLVPRVKPMRYVPEKEVAVYAMLKDIEMYEIECPYIRLALRDEVRSFLNNMEERHPGTKYSIVRSTDKLVEKMQASLLGKISLKLCRKCGMPSTRELCRLCEIFEQLGIG